MSRFVGNYYLLLHAQLFAYLGLLKESSSGLAVHRLFILIQVKIVRIIRCARIREQLEKGAW